MKNIISIFQADIKALSKQFFALAIVLGILVIPALYAWFNIYANWDPYGNTGNITVAVASDDLGWQDLDGAYVNMGETVLEELRDKDSINFVVYEDSNDALRSMESGGSYAAIILHEDFTRHMYDIDSALSDPEGTISFYENYKLNAVADKIVETAASTVAQSVQTRYLQVLFETIFGKIGEIAESIDAEESANRIESFLVRLKKTTGDTADLIGNFIGSSTEIAQKLAGMSTADTVDRVAQARDGIAAAAAEVEKLHRGYEERAEKILELMDQAIEAIRNMPETDNEKEQLQIEEMLLELEGYGNDMKAVADDPATLFIEVCEQLLGELGSSAGREHAIESLEELKQLQQDKIYPAATDFYALLYGLTDGLVPVFNSLSTTVASIDPTMRSAADTILALDDTLGHIRVTLEDLEELLDELLEKLRAAEENDLLNTLFNMLGGDSEKFAEFFACPVTVESETLYPAADYGTAMSPFYTTLAIWVGCVVLAAVIKTEADPRQLENVTENQLYWSRFILFLILNELQTLIIVLGDLHLLGIGCLDPLRFWLAAAVASFTFTALIYSIVVAFGDIGKAIVVVIMVLQIAGSSGTYPIEILQDIFIDLYKLFPFPYAIDAMREAICGFYGNDYWVYLAKLMLFAVLGFIIGLVIRKPFIDVNMYVEEEMENTGVL